MPTDCAAEALERDVKELKGQQGASGPGVGSETNDLPNAFVLSPTLSHGPTGCRVSEGSSSTSSRPFEVRPSMDFSAMTSLRPGWFHDATNVWVEKYQPWFPILYIPSLFDALRYSSTLEESPLYVVFQAIAAVTISQWNPAFPIRHEDQVRLASTLRTTIVIQAIDQLSLRSLQALLITTVLDYGAGELSKFWNVISICRRHARHFFFIFRC